MSVWATKWAYEQTVKPVGRKFVLIAIADFADESGWCFPSQETLASMTDQGVSTVRAHIKKLEADGLVKREARYAKQGGGRKSDGFWLQAPKESLKPPAKSKPPKAGGKPKPEAKHTAETEGAYRQVTGNLPPNSGGDPLVTPRTKELSAHARVMKIHSDGLCGHAMSDPAKQGAAAKWLLENSYTEAQIQDCYRWLKAQTWRNTPVTLLTVKKEIGSWLTRPKEPDPNAEKIVADYGDYYLVESSCGDGGTSKRYRTPEAFARETGRDVEMVKRTWS